MHFDFVGVKAVDQISGSNMLTDLCFQHHLKLLLLINLSADLEMNQKRSYNQAVYLCQVISYACQCSIVPDQWVRSC